MGSNNTKKQQSEDKNQQALSYDGCCSKFFLNQGFNHSAILSPPRLVDQKNYDTYPYASIFYLQSFFKNQYGLKSPARGSAFKISQSVYLTAGHCIINQKGKWASQTRLIRYQGTKKKQFRFIDKVHISQQRQNGKMDHKYDYAFMFLDDKEWNKIEPLKLHLGQIQYSENLQILSHPNKLNFEQCQNTNQEIEKLCVCNAKFQISRLQKINQNFELLNYKSNCQVGASGGAVMIKKADQRTQVCIGIHLSTNGGIKLNSKLKRQIQTFQAPYEHEKKQRIKYNQQQDLQQNMPNRESNQFKRSPTFQSQKELKRANKKLKPQILQMVGKIFEMSAKNPAFMSKIQGSTFNLESTDLGRYENISTFIKLDKNAFVNVKILNLSRNSLNDEFLDKIMQMGCWHNLKELNLSNNKIQNLKSLQNLLLLQSQQFTSLRSLYLHENQLQIGIVDFFIQHEWKLQILSLSFMWGLNEKGWEHFMKKKAFRCFQTLKMLQIYYSNDIQNDDLKEKVRQSFEQKYQMHCIVQWQQSNYL